MAATDVQHFSPNSGVEFLGNNWIGSSFYKSFYDFSPCPMGVVMAYPDDMLNLECNVAAAKFFGRTPEEAKNHFSTEMGAPIDCIREWLRTYHESVLRGQPVSFEYSSAHGPTEQVHWFCCTIYPISSPDLKPVFAYIINDVTEKKLIELEAYKWKKKLDTLINNVECIVWEVDGSTGEFLYVNEQGESQLGYSWSSWRDLDTFFRNHIHPEDKDKIPSLERLKQRRRSELCFRVKNGEGKYLTMETIISAPDYLPNMVFGVMIDVTERHKVAQLERQAEELTMKMRHKSQFVAEIIHEIRTPLNGVIGMTSLALEANDLSSEQRGFIEASLNCAESLLSIVNNILDFTKIEAGKMEIEPVNINLRNIIEESASILSVKADEKDLDLMVHYPTNLAENIVGDPTRIQQVLMNLVGNAIKFTNEGYIMISVTLNSNSIKITVADTGIGIPEENQSDVFNSFQQAKRHDTKMYGDGTGLGLSISRHLVQLMGGDIGVKSVPGKGSEFWFTLPLSAAHGPNKPAMEIVLKKKQRVLVVDPSPMYCRLMHAQLTLWNLEVVCCQNSREAMTELTNATHFNVGFHLVILANQLLLDEEPLGLSIRSNIRFKSIPIILLSRIGHRNQLHEVKDPVPFSAVNLIKPVPALRLFESICKVLQDTKSLDTPSKQARKSIDKPVSGKGQDFLRVLVVDDNIINQKITATILEKLGCKVDIQSNGKAALMKVTCEETPYNIIFMDVQMPQMNGYEASKAIREWIERSKKPQFERMAIIALTASVIDETKCTESGMQGYLIKPARSDDFRSMLQSYSQYQLTGIHPKLWSTNCSG